MMTTRSEIKAWIAGYQRDFNQLCQALMWQTANRFGSVVSTQPSAIAAYRAEQAAGRIQPGLGPAGSFVYWEIGTYGHVGMMLENGQIFMGSTHLQERWGINAGIATNDYYVARTGARLLGWSPANGGNTVPYTVEDPQPAPAPSGDWEWWQPDAAMQARIQQALKNRGRYSGPVDGAWGPNTIKGIQTTIRNVGYTGPIDGVPGRNTCYYVQVYAQRFGSYQGPLDSKLGPNSWAGFALGLERP